MIEKIVFDTNVLISATLWENSVAQKLLFKCIRENIQIFSSQEIIEEYKEILARDFDYKEQEIREILEKIFQFVTLVTPSKKVDIVKEDPDDNKILECAIESETEYIISYDKHLLKLKECQGIKIVRPEEAMKKLIFENYLKSGDLTDEEWEFCEKIDWHPVDELPLKEEFKKEMERRKKEKGIKFKNIAELRKIVEQDV